MDNSDIIRLRLLSQCLTSVPPDRPGEVVRRLGAVQSQDYAGAKWALGLRLAQASDALVEQAFNAGAILRTHVLRPTWHFVAPEDIRWMLALTAPRVHARNAAYYRKFELDQAVFALSNAVLAQSLQGGQALTREELRGRLEAAGIATRLEQRLTYIMMNAELEGIVCSGPRRGKQATYMLLDERAPHARRLDRDEALAELVRRYFLSHGPATVQDFVWWSGLTAADARRGLELAGSELAEAAIGGKAGWLSPATPPARDAAPAAFLLPNFDEYNSYSDRSAAFAAATANGFILTNFVVIDGQAVGTWRRKIEKHAVVIETDSFGPLTEAEEQAVFAAAQRYGAFLGLPVVVS